ncbi:MAG: PEP-CTERM sorting domain-containing protein [Nitrospirales bacterium]
MTSLVVLTLNVLSVHAASMFAGLGDLPGGDFSSFAWDVSADGTTVVGSSTTTNRTEAFRWTQASGIVALDQLPGPSFSSVANGVSADGSIVVGTVSEPFSSNAVLWTQNGGLVPISNVPAGSIVFNSGNDVSGDGTIVVGSIFDGFTSTAFRWTQAEGQVDLGHLPGTEQRSIARGISMNGTTVVGSSVSANSVGRFNTEAFRWTQADDMIGLGDLPGLTFSSVANDISADGATVVGTSNAIIDFIGPDNHEAFRWTQAGGMVGLGDLPGGSFFSKANDVSNDGSIVVGSSHSANGSEAFLWSTASQTMLRFQDLLDADPRLAGWQLSEATGISADGQTIVGYGINPSGNTEAWLARLNEPVPEPSTILLFSTGLVCLAVWRLRKKMINAFMTE